MGFKIDFTIKGGHLIDDWCSPPIYSQDIKVSGNSISDVVYVSEGNNEVGFTADQWVEFITKALDSSLFYELKEKFRNENP